MGSERRGFREACSALRDSNVGVGVRFAEPCERVNHLGALGCQMAQARRFDNNAMLAGAKSAESPGWLEEATMADGREHPQGGTGADRHRWFAAKVFVILAVTIVAAYVTVKLP